MSAKDDPLEELWLAAADNAEAEAAFLQALSHQRVLVILQQRPGPGEATPERNLVEWKRETESTPFVPIFTDKAHIAYAIPPPAQLVRVPMRVLLTTSNHRYIVNPLSKMRFALGAAQLALLHCFVAESHHDTEAPSRQAPWAFQFPSDALYPVAVRLVEWFHQNGRVDQAFLYELTRGTERRTDVVLGLNEPADLALADTLKAIAIQAGVETTSFMVRFLPDEPSHREGLEAAGITPFYQRPGPSRH